MELSVTQENFARALAIVGRIASSRAGLPILGNVLLRTEANRLLVAATNLEIAATCYVGAKITKPGELTLPAKLISEFIASLPRGTVDIASKGNMKNATTFSFITMLLCGLTACDKPGGDAPIEDNPMPETPTEWVLDFQDNFDGNALNTDNWAVYDNEYLEKEGKLKPEKITKIGRASCRERV